MSIEDITAVIIREAEQESAMMFERAQTACREAVSEAELKAEAIIREAERNGAAEKQNIIARRKSVAYIDGRKMMLSVKQRMISDCFADAAGSLSSAGRERYLSFLVQMVKQTGERSGILILNSADSSDIGAELIKRLEQDIDGADFMIHDRPGDMSGGFILRRGQVSVSCTADDLADEARENLACDVAEILFGKE